MQKNFKETKLKRNGANSVMMGQQFFKRSKDPQYYNNAGLYNILGSLIFLVLLILICVYILYLLDIDNFSWVGFFSFVLSFSVSMTLSSWLPDQLSNNRYIKTIQIIIINTFVISAIFYIIGVALLSYLYLNYKI